MIYFLYGLLTSFTPCVLPMVPIVYGICGKNYKGVGTYLLGSSISYVLLGLVLSQVGIYFQNIMHSYPIMILFSCALVYLALVSFGITRLPQHHFHPSNVFFMGLISPIVVSPCITPALGAIITMMMTKHCNFCGVFELFSFGLGVNLPLVIFALGLHNLLSNDRIKKFSSYINVFNGVLLLLLIGYLWRGIL